VQRRFSTRDLGLSIRMGLALAVISLIYLALVALLTALLVEAIRQGSGRGIVGSIMFLAAIPVLLWRHYADAAGLTLRALRAKPEPTGDVLLPMTERLAAAADIRPPDVLVAHSRAANALAVPTLGRPLVVVTTELMRRLEPQEVEAVLAHEVTHLANRDGAVMTFVGGPALAVASLWNNDLRGKMGAAILSPIWLIGVLLMRSVARHREYAADRGSALLTGAPEQLMSALTKLYERAPAGDLRGGAAISALCIRGFERSRLGLLQDHPPLEKRLARLAAMAREQGEPVGP
jgi:heat shock protein HtpX